MKIHFELDADGYADLTKDFWKALNIMVDDTPAFILKVRALKDLVETLAKSAADKREKALVLEPTDLDEPAAPTCEPTTQTCEPTATEVPAEPDAAA